MMQSIRQRLHKLILYFVYVGLISLSVLTLAEIAARMLLEDDTPDFDHVKTDGEAYSYFDWRAQFALDREKTGAGLVYDPYSGWSRRDKSSELINVRDGYRASWEPPATPGKRDFVIFMLGGSTTYGIESPDELTIASILARKLNHAGAKYRYVVKNYGVSAFVLDQEVHLLIKLLRSGRVPDAVIFYDGINEVIIRVGMGREHLYDPVFRALLFRNIGLRAKLRELIRRSRLYRLIARPPRLMARLFPLIDDPQQLRTNTAKMLSGYANNVRIVRVLGGAYGFASWFFWQPNIFNTAKTLTAEETWHGPEFGEIHEKARFTHQIVDQVLAERRFFETTAVVDISHALDDVAETIFLDAAHITPIGNEAVAETMLRSISADLDGL